MGGNGGATEGQALLAGFIEQVLVSGGTALYLKALTEGLFEGPAADLSALA